MLQRLRDSSDQVALAGDARYDGMGHSAKYGAHSMYSCSDSSVVHFHLVQVCLSVVQK